MFINDKIKVHLVVFSPYATWQNEVLCSFLSHFQSWLLHRILVVDQMNKRQIGISFRRLFVLWCFIRQKKKKTTNFIMWFVSCAVFQRKHNTSKRYGRIKFLPNIGPGIINCRQEMSRTDTYNKSLRTATLAWTWHMNITCTCLLTTSDYHRDETIMKFSAVIFVAPFQWSIIRPTVQWNSS